VFAEMMTGNLLLMALSIGTGSALGQSARYIPAIVAFSLGARIGGRLRSCRSGGSALLSNWPSSSRRPR